MDIHFMEYTYEDLGSDIRIQDTTPLFDKEEKQEEKLSVGPYAGLRLIRLSKEEVDKLCNGAPSTLEMVTKNLSEDGTLRALYAGSCIRSKDEKIAVETIRNLIMKATKVENLLVLFSEKNSRLKPAEDPYFEDIAKFVLTDAVPRVVEKTSFATFYQTIFEGIQKFVLKGKRYQIPKPHSLVNIREVLLYDLMRFTMTRVYVDQQFRIKLYCKYPAETRKVRVTGLHSPDRLKSVLTRDEFETVLKDDRLKRAWDAQTLEVKRITSGLATASVTNVRKRVEDCSADFCKVVGKQFLRIAYSRMKVRNNIVSSLKKGKKLERVPTPKLSTVLAAMVKNDDRYGYPGVVIPALYREDFLSVYDETAKVTLNNGTFEFEWKTKDIQSWASLRAFCVGNPTQKEGCDDLDEVEVVEPVGTQ